MADAPNVTLITRAEVTSIITPDIGRRALVLDGTTTEIGDTGPRDLSGLFLPGTVNSGQVCCQRIGNAVQWTFVNIMLTTGSTGSIQILSGADGKLTRFLPEFGTQVSTLIDGASEFLCRVLVPTSGAVAFHYAEAGRPWSGIVTFITSRPWGTAELPGVKRGDPVGV